MMIQHDASTGLIPDYECLIIRSTHWSSEMSRIGARNLELHQKVRGVQTTEISSLPLTITFTG